MQYTHPVEMDSVFLTMKEHDKGKATAADPARVDNPDTGGPSPKRPAAARPLQ